MRTGSKTRENSKLKHISALRITATQSTSRRALESRRPLHWHKMPALIAVQTGARANLQNNAYRRAVLNAHLSSIPTLNSNQVNFSQK